ncbi:arylsulfatase [uncultured Paracoccus sp.]|uniref:arylsulfatase n=1 Tax=uncultured Paracoccus sp. TaxID=189685 RepID=UPI00261C392B|nr:arylsulfatase [uncultured Paracoccus sp.]
MSQSFRPPTSIRTVLATSSLALATMLAGPALAQTTPEPAATGEATQSDAASKPNILIIYPDDVGWTNVSAYGQGVMGYTTPNIDRLAREGIMFTEHYSQPSSTAGRAALITGQYPIRSGMTSVGLPGSPLGLKAESPTLAEVLKGQGYATGQFGKNHLGDSNSSLPTVHGFDEFFGNLYHLNAEETPEQRDYPQDPEFKAKYGPRGVLHSWATDVDDQTVDPRFGKVGKQRIEDTGPLTIERMKTIDANFIDASLDFVARAKEADKPWFVWLNPSRMHLFQHLTDENRYLAQEATMEDDVYGSGMIEHDMQVGDLLEKLKAMGELDNTIVIWSTDNGPSHGARVHGGTTPFRGEKMTTYEGGVRVPFIAWWPGQIPGGRVMQGIQTNMDVFTTLAAAAGVKDVAADVLAEKNQIIDGVNNLDWWKGISDKSNRNDFIYYEGNDVRAVRLGKWKMHFATSEGFYDAWKQLKFPMVMNLHFDPYESFDTVTDLTYGNERKQWLMGPIQDLLAAHVQTLIEHPPVQVAPSFDLSKIMNQVGSGAN